MHRDRALSRAGTYARALRLFLVLLDILLAARGLPAFNPPVDQAGPLKAVLDGPAVITSAEAPLAVKVRLENAGGAALRGAARLQLIDGWRAEPARAVPFEVPGKDQKLLDFTVTPAAGASSAHYPIHALVEFEHEGKKLTAHPILILEARLPAPPGPPAPVDWKPAEVRAESSLALWRLPVSRAVLQVNGENPKVLPAGWRGSEERSRAFLQAGDFNLRGDSRPGLTMHPPWHQGLAGAILIEFPLRLPGEKMIRLSFSNAIREHRPEAGEPPSDGVTFRARAAPWEAPEGKAGEIIFERHTDSKAWLAGDADLSRFAGQSIRLQLEAHPGPKNDTTCDQAFWGEPTLVAGAPPRPLPFPPAPEAPSRLLGTLTVQGDRYEVRCWPGRRGLLDAAIGFEKGGKRLLFHGFSARVLGDGLEEERSATQLVTAEDLPLERGLRTRHRFSSWAGGFDLLGELRVRESSLAARFWLENAPPGRPWQAAHLEDVAAGRWSERIVRVYAGTGNVIEEPEPFELGFDGHRLATSFAGFEFEGGLSLLQGVDVPPDRLEVNPPAGKCTLHAPHAQTLTFIPARDVWEAVKVWREVNGLKAAGGVHRLAGRFVFDLWGGRYRQSAEELRRAFRYGLTDALVIWHNWQRWGYDYRLPDIYPPNPELGTLEEFRELVKACHDHGVLFAPHDNYIDFYPDAEGYSYDEIAFTPDRRPVRAWLNEWRGAQSYRWRADRVRPFVERNLKLSRDGFAPSAFFIDVWSSIQPYDYWTRDGRFFDRVFTRRTWGELFSWIRDTLGNDAPQISESGHDQLIGWLDGAQTNHLRVGTPPRGYYSWAVWPIRCRDAERIPWFDAAHHHRFVLHGAGYESRYLGGLDARLHGIYSDDYIATEALTGHPAMVPAPFGREVVRKYWLLHDLMRALALQTIEAVEFAGGDLHRQQVRWQNGGEVWVNRGEKDWPIAGRVLPPYGFYARVPALGGAIEAAIERREGAIADWARSPLHFFANARPDLRRRSPVRVEVEAMRFLGGRRAELALKWEAAQPLADQLSVFAHFVDESGEILFQGDHQPATPTTAWRGAVRTSARVEVPERFGPGSAFELRAGLFQRGGARLPLEGADDGSGRIRLGTLRLIGEGRRLTGISWTPLAQEADPWLERLNPRRKMISFEALATNGACQMFIRDQELWLVPLPEGEPFEARWRWKDLPWRFEEPRRIEEREESGKVRRVLPLTREGSEFTLACDPAAFAYRFAIK